MKTSRRRFLTGAALLTAGGVPALARGMPEDAGTAERAESAVPPEEAAEAAKRFELYPVGHVKMAGGTARIHILEPFLDALLGLQEWSHVNVIYWFDRNDTPEKRRILRVHPRGNRENPLTGVFACRAPFRPNLIALTTCRLVAVNGPIVTVEGIDALDGTPVLDIKPLIPPDFSVRDLRVPKWASPPR